MAKEKRRLELEEEKMYFYEISATIVILFSLITFSELGFVGAGLKSLMKILFGDYYFIIILYLILHGIIALVKRRWFDFTSIKFNGFILFILSLITLNHIGFYELLGFEKTEILSKSLTTYMNVMKSLVHINSYGGGVIGAFFLQIFIFLFNQIGSVIILIVLLALSLSFMTNLSYKTISYYTVFAYKKCRTTFILGYRYFNNIKFPNKTIKKAKLNLNLNLNMLNDCDNKANEAISYKIAVEDHELIKDYFENLGCSITDSKMDIGYITTRNIFTCSKVVYDKEQMKKSINSNVVVYEHNNEVEVQIINKVKRLLTIKHLLLNTSEVPLGMEYNNKVIKFDGIKHKNLLLTGAPSVGIKNFIKNFIISNIFINKYDFKIVLFDYNQEFIELKYLPNLFIPYSNNKEQLINNLDSIAKELERRIELLNSAGYSNYVEYNKLEVDKLQVCYVILNDIDNIKNLANKQDAKLLYFLKFGFRTGIHFIIINRSFGIEKEILVNIQTKIVFKCSTNAQSYEVLNNNNGCNLDNKGDAILNILDEVYRITTPYISNNDYDKVITKFICN